MVPWSLRVVSSCRRPARAPSTPRHPRSQEHHPAVVPSSNARAPDSQAAHPADLPDQADIKAALQARVPPWAPVPALVARCTPPVPDFPAALPAPAEPRAPDSPPAHVLDSLPVPASRRVRVALAEHPAERLKAARQLACVLHVPGSAAAVSATRR